MKQPTALALLIVLFSTLALQAGDKPNILFISVDDLNDFPAFQKFYPDAKTPNMDKLADSGTVFTRAHCQFPLCGPSRASLFSSAKMAFESPILSFVTQSCWPPA